MTAVSAAVPPLQGEVRRTFRSYPDGARRRLERVRALIFETAAALDGVGPITETLKWGEPAYLTEESRSGTTIRIGWKAARPDECALFVHCQTTLVDTCRTLFPELTFDGNRALRLPLDTALPEAALRTCIELALTYHRQRARRSSQAG